MGLVMRTSRRVPSLLGSGVIAAALAFAGGLILSANHTAPVTGGFPLSNNAPVIQALPYCAEEDGSGSPGAPCWWPAGDQDMLITVTLDLRGSDEPVPVCALDRSPQWGVMSHYRSLPCAFTDDAGTTITITEQPIRGEA